MSKKNTRKEKTIQELEAPKVDLHVDYSTVDPDPHRARPMGREYPKARSQMPESQLFSSRRFQKVTQVTLALPLFLASTRILKSS